MWYLIVECPPRKGPRDTNSHGAATDIFLDFDPVLPGWPADEHAEGEGAAGEGETLPAD
jgi:hypothetical protein